MRDSAGCVRIFIACILASLVMGCTSESIHDLALKSVTVVDSHDQAELNYDSMRMILARMAGDPTVVRDPRLANLDPRRERVHEWLVKAEFTSGTDLSRARYSDNLGSEIFFCHRPDAHTLLPTPYVYSNGSIVPSGKDMHLPRDTEPNVRPLFTYYVYFRVARNDAETASKPPLESFDLRKNPEDVCLRMVGGEYRGLGYYSNTIVVPRDMVAEVLKNLPATSPK